ASGYARGLEAGGDFGFGEVEAHAGELVEDGEYEAAVEGLVLAGERDGDMLVGDARRGESDAHVGSELRAGFEAEREIDILPDDLERRSDRGGGFTEDIDDAGVLIDGERGDAGLEDAGFLACDLGEGC